MVGEQVVTQAQEIKEAQPQVEVIRDLERFNAIAPEWDRLVTQWGSDGLFLSHTWFRTWWESFGAGNELHIVIVRSGSELVAAAPMMRTRANIYGFKADSLHAIFNHHTPRYDFIIANNQDPRYYEAIWRELSAHADCEMIVLAQVPEASRTIPSIETLAKRDGWLAGQWIAPVSPFIRLDCDYDTYFNTLRSGCRFNLTKRYTRLSRAGPVDVEVVTDRDAVEEAMLHGLRIEAAAWKGAKGTAMNSDPAVAKFYTRLATREAELGQLRLTFLRAGGKRISFNYLVENRTRCYALKIGYDPEYHVYSPGNMLLNLILKDAFARGIEEYDLLGGDDGWKFEWTAETREHRWLFLFRNRLRPRALHYLKFGVVPAIKRRS